MTTLAALSGVTSRIRLGLLVAGATYRHPSVCAPQAMTLDHASTRYICWVSSAAVWPTSQISCGIGRAVSTIRRQVPVEDYLRPQKRYAHLFGDPGRPDVVARLQQHADRNIARYGLLGEGDV